MHVYEDLSLGTACSLSQYPDFLYQSAMIHSLSIKYKNGQRVRYVVESNNKSKMVHIPLGPSSIIFVNGLTNVLNTY
jgi:hypothetical protein